ncbi:amidohydrolase [Halorientalis sp.]|uniref:amidohydrolase n=1 Tax=Halorientalis sp. TaxID=1931229 RepID=UPI0026376972|nr:amidohydrolase [Halorientalis sp.]
MADSIIANGVVVTQDSERRVLTDGAVVVEGSEIVTVGPTEDITSNYDADKIIDADGCAVIPGLINAHTHVSDILIRGAFNPDRGLFDWLYNVKRPCVLRMDADEQEIAAKLYCTEAIQSGITTFVENHTEVIWDDTETIESKLQVYDKAGIRNIYAAGVNDLAPDDAFQTVLKNIKSREPETNHVPDDQHVYSTAEALDEVESLIEKYHQTADGRQSVWPAPVVIPNASKRVLRESYEMAERFDVMTTLHVAESEIEEQNGTLSSVEYLRNAGYLGERALLGHCVQIDDYDIRILARTDTAVAHNIMANMRLATGFAPVVSMLENNVTVALGTDSAVLSDTVNMFNDVRFASSGHKGHHRETDAVSAQEAFDMATVRGAEAIGRADAIGSLEAGKKADIAIVDLNHPHLTPHPDPVSALVHNAQGFEVDTLMCDGNIIMSGRTIQSLEEGLDSILSRAAVVAEKVTERAEIG